MQKLTTRRVINNAKWIIVCKIIQSLLQLIVGMLCARYLGPSNYGLINYASAVVAFAVPIMRLGFNEILVSELTESPEKEGEIMGSALAMNLASSAVCMLGVFCIVALMNPGDTETVIVCVLYSISLVFGALEMIQYWFQYKLLSKYSSVVMVIAYIVVSIYRIWLLIGGKSVYWFAITHSVEYGVVGISLIAIYRVQGNHFSFSWERARALVSVGKYYIVSSMMVVVFQNTDHIMLTMMDGATENGIYSAAITCVAMTQFVYLAIIDSFRPMILVKKKENETEYEKAISGLYCIVLYLSVAQSLLLTVFARPIIQLMYGSEYAEASHVLQILNWYFAFSIMGTVRNVWILAENMQQYLWRINLVGAVSNVVLNALFIPFAGASGAAFASLLTQMITNFVMGFVIKPMRRNNTLLIRGISPKFFVHEIKELIVVMTKKS